MHSSPHVQSCNRTQFQACFQVSTTTFLFQLFCKSKNLPNSWPLIQSPRTGSLPRCLLLRHACSACLTLRPQSLGPPGSSVHGTLQERTWSGLPCPPTGDLPCPGIKPVSPALTGRFFTSTPPGQLFYSASVREPASARMVLRPGTRVRGGESSSVRYQRPTVTTFSPDCLQMESIDTTW